MSGPSTPTLKEQVFINITKGAQLEPFYFLN
jgi:hypothetical protein